MLETALEKYRNRLQADLADLVQAAFVKAEQDGQTNPAPSVISSGLNSAIRKMEAGSPKKSSDTRLKTRPPSLLTRSNQNTLRFQNSGKSKLCSKSKLSSASKIS